MRILIGGVSRTGAFSPRADGDKWAGHGGPALPGHQPAAANSLSIWNKRIPDPLEAASAEVLFVDGGEFSDALLPEYVGNCEEIVRKAGSGQKEGLEDRMREIDVARRLRLGKCAGPGENQGMFSASKLSPEQVAALKQRAAEGATMSDLQRHLKEEYGFTLTYMDTRFLVLDLGIELIEEPKTVAKEEEKLVPVATGVVSVTMDTLTLPGALVSGKVTFSDGETAIWMLDQTGRPGLDPDTPGYRPTQEDIMEFQKQLRALIEKSGL
jgi:hypothetical protein